LPGKFLNEKRLKPLIDKRKPLFFQEFWGAAQRAQAAVAA